MTNRMFILFVTAVAIVFALVALRVSNDYYLTAAYTVLQFVVLATAWNILGGYTGYVNFGSAAFFAIGAYSTVALHKAFEAPIPIVIIAGTVAAGLAGLALGYLTMRLKGIFFSIASLALAVVLLTFVVNWQYVGGARGSYIILTDPVPLGLPRYTHLLFIIMTGLAAVSLMVARAIERSFIGEGLAAIRDDELAAESFGVPTLRLKLFAAVVSGGMMGMAGTTFPYFVSYIEPSAVFNLSYAINSIAMPLIGGMGSWLGPFVGAVLLGTVQQVVQVSISSAWNLLIVGGLLVSFVTLAPQGIVGGIKSLLASGKRHAK